MDIEQFIDVRITEHEVEWLGIKSAEVLSDTDTADEDEIGNPENPNDSTSNNAVEDEIGDAENSNDSTSNKVTEELDPDFNTPGVKEEEDAVRNTYGDGSRPPKKCCAKNCNVKIPKEIALEYRHSIQELGQQGQELFIMGALEAQRRVPELSEHYEGTRKRRRCKFEDQDVRLKRYDMNYYFHGVSICRDMFCFLHAIGLRPFRRILDSLKTKGVTPYEHGLKNKKSQRKNILKLEDRERVINFIVKFGEDHGFPLPGRLKNLENFEITMLPTLYTRSFVYTEYCNSLCEGQRKLHRSTFTRLWTQFCPHIAAAKPSWDLCDKVRSSP